MALRSVVVQAPASPPAPRRTVVVREGAPAPKGKMADIIVGIVGLLVILAAIGLAWYLPDRTYLNPQFRVSFPETLVGEHYSGEFFFVEGSAATYDFVFEVPDQNVKSMQVQMGFEDDRLYSMPDNFYAELIAPNGTSVGRVDVMNPAPKEPPGPSETPETDTADVIAPFTTAPTPTETIIGGLTHEETIEQVIARVEPQHRVPNNGAWTIRVTLVSAGDCPQPNQDGSYPSQGFHCVFGPPNNIAAPDPMGGAESTQDPGNVFYVLSVAYTFYTVDIQELS